MSTYSKDQLEKHKAVIRRMMVLNPNMPVLQIVENLKQQQMPLSREYVTKVVRKVQGEWLHKYDKETKVIAVAKVEEMFDYLIQHLRKIIQDEEIVYTYTMSEDGDKTKKNKIRTFSQMNRIMAIKEIRETVKTMMNIKMDAGILERKLGELEVEFNTSNLRGLAKSIYDIRHKELKGGTPLVLDVETTTAKPVEHDAVSR